MSAVSDLQDQILRHESALCNLINVVQFELPFIEMIVEKLIAENPKRDWILEKDFNRWSSILAIRTALHEAKKVL